MLYICILVYCCANIVDCVAKLHGTNNVKTFRVVKASLNEQVCGPYATKMCRCYSFLLQSFFGMYASCAASLRYFHTTQRPLVFLLKTGRFSCCPQERKVMRDRYVTYVRQVT